MLWDTGKGRPPVLALHRAVPMVLFRLRQNLSGPVCAELFGVSQATVSRY
jgi:predicted transcriptional regulator